MLGLGGGLSDFDWGFAAFALLVGLTAGTTACSPDAPDSATATQESDTADTVTPDDSGDTALADDSGHERDWTVREVSLLAEGEYNHLLPVKAALDTTHRRFYSLSSVNSTVAEVDIDSGTHVTNHPLDYDLRTPSIAVDGAGVVWVGRSGNPFMLRLDPTSGDVTEVGGDGTVLTMAPLSDGGVIVVVSTDDGSSRLYRVSADGGVDDSMALEGVFKALEWTPEGDRLVGLRYPTDGGSPSLVELRPDVEPWSFFEGATLPIDAQGVVPLESGAVAAYDRSSVVRVDSDGTVGLAVELGDQLAEGFRLADGLFALIDRNAPELYGGPLSGLAWVLDDELSQPTPPVRVGLNSGYGGYDPEDGLVWVSAEDSSSAYATDPNTGQERFNVPLGKHVEWIVPDPDMPNVNYFTGRLSSLVGAINVHTGEVLALHTGVRWPVAPAYTDELLWVVDQESSVLTALSPDTLEVVAEVDPGLGVNGTLTFNSLGIHPQRGTLVLAQADADVLVEIDPDGGGVLGTHALGSPIAPEPDTQGRLEVFFAGDVAVVLRTTDGVLTAVDLDSGAVVAMGRLDSQTVDDLRREGVLQQLAMDTEQSVAYAGGFAFEPTTLETLAEWDLAADLLLWKNGDDQWLGWADQQIVVIESDGSTSGSLSFGWQAQERPVLFRPPQAWDTMLYTERHEARLGIVSLQALDWDPSS